MRKAVVLSTGLAMFSMFFGSGNLVFPIIVGQSSQGHFLLSSLGILLTGVLVPFLGVAALMLFRGDQKAFFERLGKPATFWFPLFALSIMGPFGVMARCITVAFASFQPLLPDLSLPLFSLIFCAVIFAICFNKQKIVSRLGGILTPVLLLSLAAIGYFGLKNISLPSAEPGRSFAAFKEGLFQGYQTMDLLASFFFSSFIIRALQTKTDEKNSLRTFFYSSLIAGGLLSAIYFVLVMLGSTYSNMLINLSPEKMLIVIVHQALGPFAAPVVCIAVALACLTTAVVLASLYADFLHKEVSKERLGVIWSLLITLAIGFSISTLNFSGIAAFLGPILEAIYPALIVFTLLNIGFKLWGLKMIRMPVTVSLLLKLLWI